MCTALTMVEWEELCLSCLQSVANLLSPYAAQFVPEKLLLNACMHAPRQQSGSGASWAAWDDE